MATREALNSVSGSHLKLSRLEWLLQATSHWPSQAHPLTPTPGPLPRHALCLEHPPLPHSPIFSISSPDLGFCSNVTSSEEASLTLANMFLVHPDSEEPYFFCFLPNTSHYLKLCIY